MDKIMLLMTLINQTWFILIFILYTMTLNYNVFVDNLLRKDYNDTSISFDNEYGIRWTERMLIITLLNQNLILKHFLIYQDNPEKFDLPVTSNSYVASMSIADKSKSAVHFS